MLNNLRTHQITCYKAVGSLALSLVKTGGSLRVFEELEQEVFLIGFLKIFNQVELQVL